MKVTVQVVIQADEAAPPTVVREVFHLERQALQSATLGLRLTEAKDLLQEIQRVVVGEQVQTALAQQVACPEFGTLLGAGAETGDMRAAAGRAVQMRRVVAQCRFAVEQPPQPCEHPTMSQTPIKKEAEGRGKLTILVGHAANSWGRDQIGDPQLNEA